jgi:glycosyltransferase involved in cell wall biosynthesis
MKLCAISFKECWRGPDGVWVTDGGFPRQMEAIGSLFDEMDLVIVEVEPRSGGMRLPAFARVYPIRKPHGEDLRRKLSVLLNLGYYCRALVRQISQADVVHSPVPGDISLLGMLLAVLWQKRLIARYAGSWNPNSQTTLMNRVTRECMRRFAGGSNVMLVAGSGEAGPAPEVHWLFSTAVSEADLAAVAPDFGRRINAPPRLTYCGRLSSEKGVDVLIRAMARLRTSGVSPLPRLTLAGDGPERELLERLATSLEVRDVIHFVGQLDRPALSRLLLETDVCVHPSLTESLCKAWVDAMAHGLPVIASRVGSAPQVFGTCGERGWLVPPGDSEALARTIHRTLTIQHDWPAMRRRCRTYAEALTIERWKSEIARICTRQWRWSVENGKLNAASREPVNGE